MYGITRDDCDIRVFVAVVRSTAHRVNSCVMFAGRGTDEGPIFRYQLLFVNTLASLDCQTAARLAYNDEADAICRAAGIGTAALTVTLEG